MEKIPGPAEPVRPLRPCSEQKSCYLWSKACDFSVLVRPVIVRLRFFSNGRTNLDLLPPPLNSLSTAAFKDDIDEMCSVMSLEKNLVFCL